MRRVGCPVFGRYGFVLIVLLGLAFALPCQAGGLSVEGVGVIVDDNTAKARDQAIKDALRLAVEQAVGTMVSSETMVENYETLRDEIYSKSQGYVQGYEIIEEATEGNLYRVTIAAMVSQGDLKSDVAALGLLMSRKNMPRIMIMVAEQNIGMHYWAFWWGMRVAATALSVTENTLMLALNQKGFTVVDHAVKSKTVEISDAYRIQSLSNAAVQEIGRLYDAEVVIYGKALAKLAGTVQGSSMLSAQADVSLRAVNTDNGQVIASAVQHAAAVHPSEVVAGSNALEKAARSVADQMIVQIVERWSQDVSSGGMIQVVVTDIRSYSQLVTFKERLQAQVRGVNGLYQRDFKDRSATIDVNFLGSAQDLADAISRLSFNRFVLEVRSISQHRIELRMR